MDKLIKLISLAALAALVSCATKGMESTTSSPLATTEMPLQGDALARSRSVAIEVELSNGSTSRGSGAWLGNGEVLTAAHIVWGRTSNSEPIFVTSNGVKMKADPIFHSNPNDHDLLLLKVGHEGIPTRLVNAPTAQICTDVESVGAPLHVAAYDFGYDTYASPVGVVMYKGKTWSQATTAMLSHGVSGSAVYDTRLDCIAGIVSQGGPSPMGNQADHDFNACITATEQNQDPHIRSTCAIEYGTVFITSEVIRGFLQEAREYERHHNID